MWFCKKRTLAVEGPCEIVMSNSVRRPGEEAYSAVSLIFHETFTSSVHFSRGLAEGWR